MGSSFFIISFHFILFMENATWLRHRRGLTGQLRQTPLTRVHLCKSNHITKESFVDNLKWHDRFLPHHIGVVCGNIEAKALSSEEKKQRPSASNDVVTKVQRVEEIKREVRSIPVLIRGVDSDSVRVSHYNLGVVLPLPLGALTVELVNKSNPSINQSHHLHRFISFPTADQPTHPRLFECGYNGRILCFPFPKSSPQTQHPLLHDKGMLS